MATKLAIEKEAIRNGYEVLGLRLANEEIQNEKANLKIANNWNGHKIATFSVLTASTVLAASVAVVSLVFNAHILAIAAAAAFVLFALSTILAGRITISKDLREFIDKLSDRIQELYQVAFAQNPPKNADELDTKEQERKLKEREIVLQAREEELKAIRNELEEKMKLQGEVQENSVELEKDISLNEKREQEHQKEIEELNQKLAQQTKETEELRKNAATNANVDSLLREKNEENQKLTQKLTILEKQLHAASEEKIKKTDTLKRNNEVAKLHEQLKNKEAEVAKLKQEKIEDAAAKLKKEQEEAAKKPKSVPPPVPSRATKKVSINPAALQMEVTEWQAKYERLSNEKDAQLKKIAEEKDEKIQILEAEKEELNNLNKEFNAKFDEWEEYREERERKVKELEDFIYQQDDYIKKTPQRNQIVRETLINIQELIFKNLKLDVLDNNQDPKKKKINGIKLRAINVKNEIERLINETLQKEFTPAVPAPKAVKAIEPEQVQAQALIEQEVQAQVV